MEGAFVDWDAVAEADENNQLLKLLHALPRAHWTERSPAGWTFLHIAAAGTNVAAVVALIQSKVLDVNTRDSFGRTPACSAASYDQPRALEVLCAAGANVTARSDTGFAPLDCALFGRPCAARVLLANGVRLSTVGEDRRRHIKPELVAFERGVLRCRCAVVALLRVKRKANLFWWDKFLLREMAYAIWATRYNEQWEV